jgi:predicted transglutaminase-like cysteine proteinase
MAVTRGPGADRLGGREWARRSVAFWLLAAFLVAGWAAAPARADRTGPWTSWAMARPQVVLDDLNQLPKWQRIRDWLRSGRDRSTPSLREWIVWAQSLRRLSPLQRLILIQSRVNQTFPYATDQEVWGMADYWETPTEVVAKGRTDCEGFAIFKLWLARIAGIDDNAMGIYVGVTRGGTELHANLLVNLQGHDLVLDSRRTFVVTAELMSDFLPVMLLDLDDMHLFVTKVPANIDPAALETRAR